MFKNKFISVIIPTIRAERKAAFCELMEKLKSGTVSPDEIIVVENESPPSKARNIGAFRSKGDVLVFIDDDAIPASNSVLEKVIDTLLSDESIGICGTSQDIPPGANRFQREYRRQFPRTHSPIFNEITESDMATTLFCAIRREDFILAGQFDETLPAGEDNFLRHKIRTIGKKVVIAPGSMVYHPLPKNYRELIDREKWYGSARAVIAKRSDIPQEGIRLSSRAGALLYALLQIIVFPIRLFYGGADNRCFGFWHLRAFGNLTNALSYARAVFSLKGK